MRIILTDQRDHSTREMEFNHASVSIGSDSSNILQIPSTNVPGFLAMLMPHHDQSAEKWSYIPIDPTGEATLRASALRAQTVLNDGDEIHVDRFTLRVEIIHIADAPTAPSGELRVLAKVKEHPLPPGSDTQRAQEEVTLGARYRRPLLQIVGRLGRAADFVQLIEEISQGVMEAIPARSVWVGLRRQTSGRLEFVGGHRRDGGVAVEPALLDTYEYRCLQRGQSLRIIKPDDPETASTIVVPLPVRQGALGMLCVETASTERVLTHADFDFLAAVGEAAAIEVEGLVEGQSRLKRAVADAQLALLREVQARLDPVQIPIWPQLQFAAHTRHGTARGGDIYDLTKLPNGLACLVIAHVRADILGAALGVAEVRSAFRVAAFHADPPHILMRELSYLMRNSKEPRLLDAAVVVLNPRTGAAEVCTAGDIGVLSVDGEGDPKVWTDLKAPPAGSDEHYEYGRKSVRLSEGSSLMLFTPGCETAVDREGQLLGRNRLVEAACDGFGRPALAAMDDLLADVAPFLKEGRTPDDITLLLLHRAVTPM